MPNELKVTICDDFVDMRLRQDALEKSLNPIGHLEANCVVCCPETAHGVQNVIFYLSLCAIRHRQS